MKNQSIFVSKFLCYMVLGYCFLWALAVLMAILMYSNVINLELIGFNIVPLQWIEDDSVVIIQWIEMIGYIAISAVMIAILLTFVIKLLKGFKRGEVFTRSNMRLLYMLATASFFFELFQMNKHIISGVRTIVFTSELLVTPIIILLVAMLYNLAVKATEENKLTI